MYCKAIKDHCVYISKKKNPSRFGAKSGPEGHAQALFFLPSILCFLSSLFLFASPHSGSFLCLPLTSHVRAHNYFSANDHLISIYVSPLKLEKEKKKKRA